MLEREGAAEGLDGLIGLVAREGRVACRDEAAEFPLLADGVPGEHRAGHEKGAQNGRKSALHGVGKFYRNLGATWVSNPVVDSDGEP